MNKVMMYSMLAALALSPMQAVQAEFESLSPGNKMIARSLMDAQVVSENGEIWTLDDIAAAKSHAGWGQVFQQMQSDGVIEARNLGMVVSNYVRSTHGHVPEWVAVEAGIPADDQSAVNETDTGPGASGTAASRSLQVTTGRGAAGDRMPDHAKGKGPAAGQATVDITQSTDVGVTTGAGRGGGANVNVNTAAGGNAQGNRFGVDNSISAGKGVTVGTGATVGAAGHSVDVSTGVNSAAGGKAAVNAGGVNAGGANAGGVNAAATSTTAAGGPAGAAGQGLAHGRSR